MNCLRVFARNTKQVMRVLKNGWMGGNLQLEVQSTHVSGLIAPEPTHHWQSICCFVAAGSESVSLAQLIPLKDGPMGPKVDETKIPSMIPKASGGTDPTDQAK